MDTKRLQVDLTEKEHTELDRLSEAAGLKTKREFVVNALTLFRWAANELAAGRQVGSFGPGGSHLKQLEMPCLMPFTEVAARFAAMRSSPAELRARVAGEGVPIDETLAMLDAPFTETPRDQDRNLHLGGSRRASEAQGSPI